jgi:hypothetical protein
MALSDYTELQAAIAKWAWNTGSTEFEASIPDMITLLETRLNRELRVRDMEATSTISLSSSAGALPTDFLEARSVKANTSPASELDLVTPDYVAAEYATSHSGYPIHYTITGSAITVYPSTTATVTLRYYQKIPALADFDTNWLLGKYPDIYLFGSLVEASDFMRDMEELQKFAARFDAAVNSLRKADAGARYSRAIARVSGPTP